MNFYRFLFGLFETLDTDAINTSFFKSSNLHIMHDKVDNTNVSDAIKRISNKIRVRRVGFNLCKFKSRLNFKSSH